MVHLFNLLSLRKIFLQYYNEDNFFRYNKTMADDIIFPYIFIINLTHAHSFKNISNSGYHMFVLSCRPSDGNSPSVTCCPVLHHLSLNKFEITK